MEKTNVLHIIIVEKEVKCFRFALHGHQKYVYILKNIIQPQIIFVLVRQTGAK